MPFACPPITVAMVWVCTMQNKGTLLIQREERKERKAQAEWHNTTNKHCELTPELDMCTIKNTIHIKAQRIRAYPSHLRHLFLDVVVSSTIASTSGYMYTWPVINWIPVRGYMSMYPSHLLIWKRTHSKMSTFLQNKIVWTCSFRFFWLTYELTHTPPYSATSPSPSSKLCSPFSPVSI